MTGSLENIHPTLLTLLTQLEAKVGYTLHINSGYRDPEHNTKVGGVPDSEHTTNPAQGVDVACVNGLQRWDLITGALALGVLRIGVGRDFVHLGIAKDKPERVIWTYYA